MRALLLFITALLIIGICLGNPISGFPFILYIPVIVLWDLPLLILPLAEFIMIALSIYSLIKKDYNKYVYKYLFLIIVYSVVVLLIDNLFKNSSLFSISEYIRLYIYILIFLSSFGVVYIIEKRGDVRWYAVINLFILAYLIYKIVNIV